MLPAAYADGAVVIGGLAVNAAAECNDVNSNANEAMIESSLGVILSLLQWETRDQAMAICNAASISICVDSGHK